MNYRHNYHAGNAADVFKHIVLTLVLRALHKKDTPFCVLDTHAGSGAYTLERPGEYEAGIGMVWPERKQWPELSDYFAVVESANSAGVLVRYPGSPWIIREYLRPQDRAVFMELQPGEYMNLMQSFSGAGNIGVHHADAWSVLKAFVPPRENRGLVLIDPPYEVAHEFDNVLAMLQQAVRHWRNGIYLVWYPVKSRERVDVFYRAIRALEIEAQAIEFMMYPDDVENRLNGSGMTMINTPWGVLDALREQLPPLARRLAGEQGRPDVQCVDLRGGYAA